MTGKGWRTVHVSTELSFDINKSLPAFVKGKAIPVLGCGGP
jgi:hypothetical protein